MLRVIVSTGIILFGSVFLIGGLVFLSVFNWPMLTSWHSMKGWHQAEADILTLEGWEDAVEATYYYEYMGLSYEGDRVYVAEFYSDQGDYHWEMYQYLEKALGRNKPVTIWVNPYNPQEAVIDRSMRWGLFTSIFVFCSVFIGVGLLIIVSGIPLLRSKPEADRSVAAFDEPQEPNTKRSEHQGSADYKQAVVTFNQGSEPTTRTNQK